MVMRWLSGFKRRGSDEEVGVISAGMVMDGNITASQQILVEGSVRGSVTCETFLQGASGSVVGNIRADKVRIGGTIRGDIAASAISLQSTARVIGDITYDALLMAAGSQVDGRLLRRTSEDRIGRGSTEVVQGTPQVQRK
jgi:cytoskeletal protein CcmA (bactofilin family)